MVESTLHGQLRKVRAHDDVPFHVEHPEFETDQAHTLFGPGDEIDEIINSGHMIDEVTRDRSKRMHYAAFRLERAVDSEDRRYWRNIYHAYRNQIILGNRKLIFRAVQRWNAPPQLRDDLIGDCQIVFLQAVGAFNPWLNIRFSTYSFTCLMRALSRITQRRGNEKHISGLPIEEILESMTDPVEHEDIAMDFVMPFLEESHELLSSREKSVLKQRYRLGDQARALTLEEVGRRLHLSKERVRQVQKNALDKLKAELVPEEAGVSST